MKQKHIYHIAVYTKVGTDISWSDEQRTTYTKKRLAIASMKKRAKKEKKDRDLWVSAINQVIVAIEDESGRQIKSIIAFERN